MAWFSDYLLPMLSDGFLLTLELTVLGGLAALAVSFIAGLLRLSRNRVVRGATRTYVEFFRGTSLLVQLFWIWGALPALTGYRLNTVLVAVLTFGLSYGAYGSEVVRGSILAVPKAQWEATTALSMSRYDRMRRVILPQAIPLMLPTFGNLLIELMKGTALVYLIALTDITAKARELRNVHPGDSLIIFSLVLVIYFLLGLVLMRIMRLLERRANANLGRPQPPLFPKVKWLPGRPSEARV